MRAGAPQAERINLLKQTVEKYGNGKKDEDLTPCVVLESEPCSAGLALRVLMLRAGRRGRFRFVTKRSSARRF